MYIKAAIAIVRVLNIPVLLYRGSESVSGKGDYVNITTPPPPPPLPSTPKKSLTVVLSVDPHPALTLNPEPGSCSEVNGKAQGQGRYEHPDGDVYIGGWQEEPGLRFRVQDLGLRVGLGFRGPSGLYALGFTGFFRFIGFMMFRFIGFGIEPNLYLASPQLTAPHDCYSR